jgi:hypothetical protein
MYCRIRWIVSYCDYFQSTEVRWNSLYLMLERFLQNRAAVDQMGWSQELLVFSVDEWTKLEAMCDALKPMYDCTIVLQSRNSTIACVLPMYHALISKLSRKSDQSSRISRVQDAIRLGLESRMVDYVNDRFIRFQCFGLFEIALFSETSFWQRC